VSDSPLVSVGVPVRNGSQGLSRALSSLVCQTHSNLEIIISDNCSEDDTESICRGFVDRDSRITYFRQASPLTTVEQFRYVFEQSHGDYFMWAAHDDWRSADFVEVLLRGFKRAPTASLVFSAAWFSRDPQLLERKPYGADWDSVGLSFWAKLKKQSHRNTVHIYGLINPRHLLDYPWYIIPNSPDVPLMLWLLCRGDFVYEEGATFVYYNPGKTFAQSVREVAYVEISDNLAAERLAWTAAIAVCDAEHRMGRRRSRFGVFLAIYIWRDGGVKNTLYRWTPTPLRRLWRAAKTTLARRRKQIAKRQS
jgi:glycosyltransferase involved in cell wall biosynthesis